MTKHRWISEPIFKTAKQLLEERKVLPMKTCHYPGCEVVIFHKGKYCRMHELLINKTKVED